MYYPSIGLDLSVANIDSAMQREKRRQFAARTRLGALKMPLWLTEGAMRQRRK
jgi:hypothetical protein